MILNAISIVQYLIQIKNEIIIHVNVNVKIIVRAKKIIGGILALAYNKKNLKSTSAIEFYEIISAMDIVSIQNTNVTSTPAINCHSIKVKDCYILHTVY